MIVVISGRARVRRGRVVVEVTMNDRAMNPCRVGFVQMFGRQRTQKGERQQTDRRGSLAKAGRQQDRSVCRRRNLKVNHPAIGISHGATA